MNAPLHPNYLLLSQKTTMETATTLKRQTKDVLVERLMNTTKDRETLSEKVLAAAVVGGALGFIIGLGW